MDRSGRLMQFLQLEGLDGEEITVTIEEGLPERLNC
jgi:hypothetical protein